MCNFGFVAKLDTALLWYVNSDSMIIQSLIIRHTGGKIFLNAAQIQHVGKLFERLGGGYNSHDRVCVLWDCVNPV